MTQAEDLLSSPVRPSVSPPIPQIPYDLSQDIPFDPKTCTGKFQNGMTYYVRANSEPRDRAELRIVIKVGSLMETEEERGIAHMIEHLAFRSSKGMEGEFEVVKELELSGVRFGAHQNAYTSFEETVYELTVPLNLVDRGLRALKQLALEVRLSDDDVEKERSIVVEEWRQGRGVGQRAGEHSLKQLCMGSLYTDRLPIGLMEVINTISPAKVRAFYERHYVPEVMAVIAVGDFPDVKEIIGQMEWIFGTMLRVERFDIPRPPCTVVPIQPNPLISVFRDKEATSTMISLDLRVDYNILKTVGDYRRDIKFDLFFNSLTARLKKRALCDDPPFLGCGADLANVVGKVFTMRLEIVCRDDGVMRALTAALEEIERIKVHGLSSHEISAVRRNILADQKSQWLERNQTHSAALCSELVSHFTQGVPAPGLEWECGVTTSLMETIDTEEVIAVSKAYTWGPGTVLTIILPDPPSGIISRALILFKGPRKIPEENLSAEAVSQLLNSFLQENPVRMLERWNSVVRTDFSELIPKNLTPGTIVSKKEYKGDTYMDFSGVELVLSNGMKITYRQTDFLDDEVLLSFVAQGGLTELPMKQLPSGRMAVQLVSDIGVFGVAPELLDDMLTGKRVGVAADIDLFSRRFGGTCSAEDLETALQMVYRLMTASIIWDEKRLTHAMDVIKEALINRTRDPKTRFDDLWLQINAQNHPFLRQCSIKDIDPKLAINLFKKFFLNPQEFRAIVCGSFDKERAEELFEKYLGSLPVPTPPPFPIKTPRTVTGLNIEFPKRQINRTLRLKTVDGNFVISTLTLPVTMGGPKNPTHEGRMIDTIYLVACVQLLERRLIEVLRFILGSIYNVSVQENFQTTKAASHPEEGHSGVIIITYTCHPKDIYVLKEKILLELDKLRTEGALPHEIEGVVASEARSLETAKRTNNYWISSIESQYHSPRFTGDAKACYDELHAAEGRVRGELTPETTKSAFKKFIPDLNRYTFVCLVPKPFWRTALNWTLTAAAVLALGGIIVTRRRR